MSPLRRALRMFAGLALMATVVTTFASAAAARPLPPNDNGEPVIPDSPTSLPHTTTLTTGLPTWAILTIILGALLVAVALGALTLAAPHGQRTRQHQPPHHQTTI